MIDDTAKVTGKQLRKLLSQEFWMINKNVYKNLGWTRSLWLADVISKFDYFEKREMLTDDDYFFCTKESIEESTGISLSQQTTIINDLKELGILIVDRRGLPSKNYYKFNAQKLIELYTNENCSNTPTVGDLKDQRLAHIIRTDSNKNKDNNIVLTEVNTTTTETAGRCSNKSKLIREGIKASTIVDGARPSKLKRRKVSLPVKLNKFAEKIVDYWKMSGLKSPVDKNGTYKANLLAAQGLLDGNRLGQAYTFESICQTIDNFKLAALSYDHAPANTKSKEYFKSLYFHKFVLDPYNKLKPNHSLFKEYFDNPPKLLRETVKPLPDPDPEITNFLKNSYHEKALGGSNIEWLSQYDENAFRLATLSLQKFWKANQNKFSYGRVDTVRLAHLLIDAMEGLIEDKYNGDTSKWELWWFKKEDFLFKELSKYMYNQALLK